jgi:homoserine dehydrogenase
MAQDRPGVLAQVAGILGRHDISIVSVIQKGRAHAAAVPVVMMTHGARERDLRAALAEIDRLPVVAAPTVMLRVEPPPEA